MIKLAVEYSNSEQTDPTATLTISWENIEQVYLSVASRAARNRTGLYSQKHRGGELASRMRTPDLTSMNMPISEHYKSLPKSLDNRRVIAFPISDLTANPLRPHYDASIGPEQAFAYGDCSDTRLFYLEDEPIGGDVPYTLLFSYEKEGQPRFAIHHGVKIKTNGVICDPIPEIQEILTGLSWWAACPPLLMEGKYNRERYAFLDYDVRHLFGFPRKFPRRF